MRGKCAHSIAVIAAAVVLSLMGSDPGTAQPPSSGYLVNDAHVHLTNYIQEGPSAADFLKVMGNKVGRSVLFGLPLQQMWSYANTGIMPQPITFRPTPRSIIIPSLMHLSLWRTNP